MEGIHVKAGQIMIQDFINKMIVKEVQEDDIIYYLCRIYPFSIALT